MKGKRPPRRGALEKEVEWGADRGWGGRRRGGAEKESLVSTGSDRDPIFFCQTLPIWFFVAVSGGSGEVEKLMECNVGQK
jgi:hypothetical protein